MGQNCCMLLLMHYLHDSRLAWHGHVAQPSNALGCQTASLFSAGERNRLGAGSGFIPFLPFAGRGLTKG